MKRIFFLLSMLIVLSPSVWAVDDLMSRQMVDQARDWSQKGRDDLAEPVWRRVLSVEPSHPEALIKLGLLEARAGNLKEAQSLYQRASKLLPTPKGLSLLSTALGSVNDLQPLVKTAPKTLPAEPVKRDLIITERPLIKKPVESTSTVEIKRIPKDSGQSWEDRRLSLEKAAQDHPGDARHLLALASHLTQREPTRREAIRQLEALGSSGLRASEIKKPWKKALLALTPQQGDQVLFKNYLTRHPSSTSVERRLNTLDGKDAVKMKNNKGAGKTVQSSKNLNKDDAVSDIALKPACSNTSCK